MAGTDPSSDGREAVAGRHRIVVVGAGPGGLCMGAKLREAGYEDFVILERSDGVGGTWRTNSYPGAACDVQSHLYSFSFFRNVEWSLPYSRQPEILDYFERFAKEHRLEPHLRLGVEVRGARWDDGGAQWHVDTDRGTFVADVVVGAVGMFNDLNWPDIPGLETFAGTMFHSARWDHDHDLSGESVAVIGSGASAIQFVPEIAPTVGRLFHFQRQPQWVLPKAEDEPYPEETIARFRRDPAAANALRDEIFDRIEHVITFSDPQLLRASEEAGLRNLALVEDPVTREKLTPRGPWGCHRPLSSNVYYPTFNLPHVEVVTDAIEKVTPAGIVTVDGVERAVDTIILGTGFATTRYLGVIDVVGRRGLRLADAWADGPQAYLGIATAGFPNLFMLYGPNTNNGSILFMIECQVAYILRQLERMETEGLRSLDVRPDAMARYNERLQQDLDRIEVWQAGGCHGYYRVPSGRIVTQWPHTMTEYADWTGRPDADAYDVH
ncbi:MAG TPA: NAD(P)/FAD-dependent oxidoreductase [Acidimicrobiia bacterium]|nr:NAD(P)/FAD-dependent oxidoreductase [Acidimicrobiia bacterium]